MNRRELIKGLGWSAAGSALFTTQVEAITHQRYLTLFGTVRPHITVNKANGQYLLAGELDSLTNGAGGSNYRTTFVPAMKALKGDAGFGYIPCNNGSINDVVGSSVFGKTGGVLYSTDVTTLDARGRWTGTGSTQRNKSPGGLCLYTIGAAGADNWTFNLIPGNVAPYAYPANRLQSSYGYDRLTLYFEIAAGASFSYRQNNAPAGTRIAVNDGTNTPNTIQSITLTQNPIYNTSILCELITGDCIFYGTKFWVSTNPNMQGVQFTDFGFGGVQTASWAGMDDTYQRAWASLLAFDAHILNGGMNDRNLRSPSEFLSDIGTVASRQASAGAKLLVASPNQPSDYATSNMPGYGPAYASAAASNAGSALVNDVSVMGNYAQAVANSLMFDTIHPNAAGNALRAGLYQRSIVLT